MKLAVSLAVSLLLGAAIVAGIEGDPSTMNVAATLPPDADWAAVTARYRQLPADEAESCRELELLARAGCLTPDNRDRDAYAACIIEYTPRRCGGTAE